MKNSKKRGAPLAILIVGALCAACGGGGGGGGGGETAAMPSVMTKVSSAVPATVCPSGGIQVDAGIDDNGNGVLDPAEVDSTQYVCNGADGADGTAALVAMTDEPAGAHCATGGKKMSAGLDTNGNAILDPSEVTSAAYICNGLNGANGTNGSNGLNSLVAVVSEPSGSNCTYGGLKITSGVDLNGNGILDSGEAGAPSFVCSGPTAPALPAAPQNVAAKGGDGQVTVTWSAVPGAYSYNIYTNTTGSVTTADEMILNASMPYVHAGRTNGVVYYYRVAAVNSTGEGALSSEVAAKAWLPFSEMLQKIAAGDAQPNDNFGYSVSSSGDYTIVGAPYEDGGAGDPLASAGAAYIFHRTGTNTWDSGTKIVAPDAQAGDQFGVSVSINGDYAIVGAYAEDGGAGDPMISAGAAYIFHRTGFNTWDSGTKIVAPDAHGNDNFGISVSISGDYAIVGAYAEDGGTGNPLTDAGAAYIFHRTGTNTWDSGTKIVATDAQATDNFGNAVSISGDYAIVGAYTEDGGAGNPLSNAGAAYIFHRTGVTTWDNGTKIVAPDVEMDDYFGNSVSLSGDYAIVGARGEDGGAGSLLIDAGAAYIFHRAGVNIWDSGTKIAAQDRQTADNFGESVSISGDYAIVGAPREDGGAGNPLISAGAAYIFHRSGVNTWDSGKKILALDIEANDGFGWSVSISGDCAIIGARSESGGPGNPLPGAGAAYIY